MLRLRQRYNSALKIHILSIVLFLALLVLAVVREEHDMILALATSFRVTT